MKSWGNAAAWRHGAAGAGAALVLVAALAGGGYATGWRIDRPAATATCVVDGAIDPATRQALDRAALDFVTAVSGANPGGAYDMLADATKDAISHDKFVAALHSSLAAVAPFTRLRVDHAYFVRASPGQGGGRVVCGSVDGSDDSVTVATKPLSQQAHLVVDAEARQEHWAFALWLVPEQGWRVAGFDFMATGMGGKSLSDILALADGQRAAHHDFNALLLYGAAAHLASRGRDLQLGVDAAIQGKIAALPVPDYLRGKAPLNWRIDGTDYKIDNIGAAGVGDKLYLAITQELSPWRGDADADTRNRLLIGDFTQAVPEYAAAFSGLILLARDQSGGHLYRTVATAQPRPDAKPRAEAKPTE